MTSYLDKILHTNKGHTMAEHTIYQRLNNYHILKGETQIYFNLQGTATWLENDVRAKFPNASISDNTQQGRYLYVTLTGDEASQFQAEAEAYKQAHSRSH